MGDNWERKRGAEILDLKYWKSFKECYGSGDYVTRVSLHNGYGLTCDIGPGETICIHTNGNSCFIAQDWFYLIKEAEEVRQHYFPN